MIEKNVANWHLQMRGKYPGGLDELLHDDCVFYSPVVFTPQKGKELTKLYLTAAGGTFGDGEKVESDESTSSGENKSKFRYTKEILGDNQAALEFESELGGKYVNGVDIITWDDDGKIIEFKVMIRPLQAINMLHEKMRLMLESMQS